MKPMRTIILSLAIATLAAPAIAQTPDLDVFRAQQEAATRRAVELENRLSTLDARLKADQAVADLQASRYPPSVPELRYAPSVGAAPAAETPKYPSIPDAALADSNRRVQAISKPKP